MFKANNKDTRTMANLQIPLNIYDETLLQNYQLVD